jgi:hypothetical protein
MAAVVVVLWVGGVRAADEVTEAASLELFRSAFAAGVPPRRRVEILERVAVEYPKTRWADDALWILSEYARKAGRPRTALKYSQELIENYPKCRLEGPTRTLEVYVDSRIPQVVRVIEKTGHHVVQRGRRLYRYNPLPMVVHEDIAIELLKWRQPGKALEHLESALKAGPPGGLYIEFLQRRIKDVREDVARGEDSGNDPGDAPEEEPGDEPVPGPEGEGDGGGKEGGGGS